MLHPQRGAQKVLLCDSCETLPLQSHCKINLCANCVSNHVSDSSKGHNVVPFLHRNNPKCPKYVDKHCELYCEECDTPVCSTCVSSGKHKGHDISEVLQNIKSDTQSIQHDLEELETRIYPQYEDMASDIQTEKAELKTHYRKLTTSTDPHGEVWHREITAIVKKRKYDVEEMKTKHLTALENQSDEITHIFTELRQLILNLRKILNSNDVSLTSTYKSSNDEFRRIPPKVKVTFPIFSPPTINTEQLHELLGSFSSLSITKEGYTMNASEAVSSPPIKPFLDEPRLTATIDTGYRPFSVSCLSEEEVWVCGKDKIMKLLNLQGKLLTSIKTESGNVNLVYTDTKNKTINIVKNKQIQTVITLTGWRPRYVCRTSSDDLLVTIVSDDLKQSKVVRYSGSTETQTIQFEDQGHRLYLSGGCITENGNFDICVSDCDARAVVVVNQSEKLRFRYTGHPSNAKKPFSPVGIATGSQRHILTADTHNNRIHILDHDGQFLRYIENCGLDSPNGLCVDSKDNLFVNVNTMFSSKVKRIQYI